MSEVQFEIDAVSDRDTREALAGLLGGRPRWAEHDLDTGRASKEGALPERVIVVGDVSGLSARWDQFERLRAQHHVVLAVLVLTDFQSEEESLSDLLARSVALQFPLELCSRRFRETSMLSDWANMLLGAIDSLVERMSSGHIRFASFADGTLFVRFGDGFARAFQWNHLPFATRTPKLCPETARVGDDYDTLVIDDEDGEELEVDALALRALVDRRSAREVEELAQRSQGLLGSRLRAIRERCQLTQNELAERSGIPQSSLSKIEAGEREPRLQTLKKYAGGLGLELSQLLDFISREV